MGYQTTHQWAKQLQETASHLLARPDLPISQYDPVLFTYFYDKKTFLATARAMGPGKKEHDKHDFNFSPTGTCIRMSIARNIVCRKVQKEKWECEPLLSGAEEESIAEEVL
jgi:hypothetical protein